ncbi:MAG: DNA (cytosine-5-)-methyltransferase, partial [Tannerella sp.]|nr:DNA (cytosine-5-)-methyltransferase [Tannerella sp.]
MTHASLCSGIGAAELAATWTGWENAFLCENDPFCRRVLNYWFNKSKIYGDIRETDFSRWNGRIDVLTAGFPCQPFSVAGRRKGADDDRYLWPEIIRVIGEVQPRWFIGENVAGIVSMVQPGSEVDVENTSSLFGEDYTETVLEQEYIPETVCGDLEHAGYAVQPVIIPACAVGAPHRRDRIFFIANRSDAGTESLRERQNGIHERPAASDAAGDRGDRERTNGDGKAYNPEKRNTARYISPGFGIQQTVTHAPGKGLQGELPRNAEMFTEHIPDWRHFPTQPPVHWRDDGLSAGLSDITF